MECLQIRNLNPKISKYIFFVFQELSVECNDVYSYSFFFVLCYFCYYSFHPPRKAQANLRVEPQICIVTSCCCNELKKTFLEKNHWFGSILVGFVKCAAGEDERSIGTGRRRGNHCKRFIYLFIYLFMYFTSVAE